MHTFTPLCSEVFNVSGETGVHYWLVCTFNCHGVFNFSVALEWQVIVTC